MLRMVGGLLLACAAAAWAMAVSGQCSVVHGVSLELMFSGLAFALVSWWRREPIVAEHAVDSVVTPVAATEEPKEVAEPEPIAEVEIAAFGSIPAIMPEI